MIEASYRHCRRLTRQAASNFYWSFHLFPRPKRRALHALYAFSRCTDDLGDSDAPSETRRAQLDAWRESLQRSLAGDCEGAIWPALRDAVDRFAIPENYLFQIIDGVAMDLTAASYQTFDELQNYCYHVASAVGLACIHIWGFEDPRAIDLAQKCGIAFQMTNILRDLHEDALQQRVYLPREDLARFHYDPAGFHARVCDRCFHDLVAFEIARTRQLYDESAGLAHLLAPDSRRGFYVMHAIYRALLDELDRRTHDILRRRISLGSRRKLALLLHTVLFPPESTSKYSPLANEPAAAVPPADNSSLHSSRS